MTYVSSVLPLGEIEPASVSRIRSRWDGRLAWLAVAVQCFGSLIIWLVSHSISVIGRSRVSSEILVSSGWYDHQSAYAKWVYGLPIVPHLLDAHATHVFGLGAGLANIAAGYLLALVLAVRSMLHLHLRRLLLLTVAIALPLLLVPQMYSSDVWSYVFYGRIPLIHGGNPFVDLPSAYSNDPFLPRLFWKTTASVYGPAWVAVSVLLTGIAQLLGGAAGVYLLTFKTFLFACHLMNIALIYRLLRIIRPGTETWGTIFYAWNPLVLFEFACNSHNDVFMITLILIGVACAVAERPYLAAAFLTAAGLAKLTGLLGLPVYAIYVGRRSQWPVATIGKMLAVSLAVVALLYAPFWHGLATFRGTADAPNFKILYRSPAAVAENLLGRTFARGEVDNQWAGQPPLPGSRLATIRSGVRFVCLAAFSFAFLLLTIWPVRSVIGWVERFLWIYVAYVVFGALYFNPWYLTWLIPLAALIRRPWPVLVGTSLFFLLIYLPWQPKPSHVTFLYWPWPLLAVAMWQAWRWGRNGSSPQAETAADAAPAM